MIANQMASEAQHVQPVMLGPDATEEQILASCHSDLLRLQETAPDWFAYYDDAQPDSAERAVLVDLLKTAPSDFSKGLLYGLFIMRQNIAGMTQREFD